MARIEAQASTAVDSSVLVASYLPKHQFHRSALSAIEVLAARKEGFVLVAHAILETYAVLTRLPAPHRVSQEQAARLLRDTCERRSRVVRSLPPESIWSFLTTNAERQVGGGRIYDAAILASAVAAGAKALVTLNPRHFEALAPAGFSILSAGEA